MKKLLITVSLILLFVNSYASFWMHIGCYTVDQDGNITFTIEFDHNRVLEEPNELKAWVTIPSGEVGPFTATTIVYDPTLEGYYYTYFVPGSGLSPYNLNNPCLPFRIGDGSTGIICPCPCDANFCYTVNTRYPLQYTFTYSDVNFNYHRWDFGDGGVAFGNSVVHDYAGYSSFIVCQTVGEGKAEICNRCIGVCPNPTYELAGGMGSRCDDGFTYTICTNSPAKVNFVASGSYSNYLWDFGDGNTSANANPTHTYAAPGTYKVCLSVSDGAGTSCTLCTSVCIYSTGNKPGAAGISNLSSNAAVAWNVYPNPAADYLTVGNSGNGIGAGYTITDLTGRTLYKGMITMDKQKIDINALPAGIYIINLRSNDRVTNIKFSKQ